MIVKLVNQMLNKLCIFMMIIYLLSTTSFFSNIMTKKQATLKEKLLLIGVFGAIGAMGNYLAIEYNGALVNTRIIGVAAGGIYGGSLVGFGAAIIAVISRIIIGKGDFTILACCLSTPIEGILSSYFSKSFVKKENRWMIGMALGALCELLRKAMVLAVSRPFYKALDVVKVITFPMTLINSIGLAIFIVMVDKIFDEQEKLKSHQARLCLNIASKTLPILRKGLNANTAERTAKIIYSIADFDAVSIINKNEILSHIGIGSDHHKRGSIPFTRITQKVLERKHMMIAHSKKNLGCKHKRCKLGSAIVVPLKNDKEFIGVLKLYRCRENSISNADIEIGTGLAHLFSVQLELSKLEEQRQIISNARIKILQSQMNPHFLFNSLNAISVLCRIDPLKARSVIKHLSNYYRKNLKSMEDLIDLKDEIDHVKSYLAIEKARFNKKLQIVYDIDENINMKIPPLTIQPLVENAINHGILPKAEGGTIWIKIENTDDFISISVKDNGIGMDEDMLDNLRQVNLPMKSLGLELVVKRLKFIYGDRVRFKIKSKLNDGTLVKLVILHSKEAEASESIVS